MYFPIRRGLLARPEPDNTFWTASTIESKKNGDFSIFGHFFKRVKSILDEMSSSGFFLRIFPHVNLLLF